MNQPDSTQAVQRLTALWAFSEAGLGGILHALNMPFKGLILSSVTAICITMIAHNAPNRTAILRSLLVVLIVKAAVAPNSSPASYFALGFQGVAGYLLFSMFSGIRIPALLLTTLAVTYSSVQKVIVAYLLYGEPLVRIITKFSNFALKFFGAEEQPDIALWLIGAYVGIHTVSGVIIGLFAGTLPRRIEIERCEALNIAPAEDAAQAARSPGVRHKVLFFLLLPLGILLLFAIIFPDAPEESAVEIALILARVLCVLVLWYGVIAGFAMTVVRRALQRKRLHYAAEVEHVLLMLPALRRYIFPVWRSTDTHGGFRRIAGASARFIALVLYLPLSNPEQPNNERSSG